LNDEEVVGLGAEGETVEDEAKKTIDFEASWFDQTWTDGFEMQWTEKTEDAVYVPKPLSTRPPDSVW